jgi:hypothetical protein
MSFEILQKVREIPKGRKRLVIITTFFGGREGKKREERNKMQTPQSARGRSNSMSMRLSDIQTPKSRAVGSAGRTAGSSARVGGGGASGQGGKGQFATPRTAGAARKTPKSAGGTLGDSGARQGESYTVAITENKRRWQRVGGKRIYPSEGFRNVP